jgi:glycine dehydrogenase subunit 2
MPEATIYEISSPGRVGFGLPALDVPPINAPANFLREGLPLPELSELDVIRHFTNLSRLNYSIDSGFYPLGSCTMKYNPRINEVTARLPGFTYLHPLQPTETIQGSLLVMYLLQEWLKEITGFSAATLQPAAGAHGELVGGLIIHAYHRFNGNPERNRILIPDSAHGTNPATSNMSGFEVVSVPTGARGNVDCQALSELCDSRTAGLMLTNPNTLGLFEEQVVEVNKIVHDAGGLVYGDGANLNALLGIVKPHDLGFDIMHINLHKTFSTPHGGGGPGSGPVVVADFLREFLPGPIVAIIEEGSEDVPPLYGFITPKHSIGRMKAFHGHFSILVRAMTYMMIQGKDGLRAISDHAVLNANYLMSILKDHYTLPFDRVCKHEFVLEGIWDDVPDIHALDVAKRLIDYGFHPPTNYFPLNVHEALMIEPTETESKDTLDQFAEAMIKIAGEARTAPQLLRDAPHNAPVKRLDEVRAAKDLVLCCWTPDEK